MKIDTRNILDRTDVLEFTGLTDEAFDSLPENSRDYVVPFPRPICDSPVLWDRAQVLRWMLNTGRAAPSAHALSILAEFEAMNG